MSQISGNVLALTTGGVLYGSVDDESSGNYIPLSTGGVILGTTKLRTTLCLDFIDIARSNTDLLIIEQPDIDDMELKSTYIEGANNLVCN